MSLIIEYAYKKVVVFRIDVDLFYLKRGPNTPQIYDVDLRLMVVPNIDSWLQSKTHQRYSYRGVCDMADAFKAGLNHSYTHSDLEYICKVSSKYTIDIIFKTYIISEFSSAYWVELMNPIKIYKFIDILRTDFDKFRLKYGDDELYNILCRLWQFSNLHSLSETAVFESLIRKIGRIPQSPKYPDTSLIDSEVEKLVTEMVVNRNATEFKNISDELVTNAKLVQEF